MSKETESEVQSNSNDFKTYIPYDGTCQNVKPYIEKTKRESYDPNSREVL